MIESFVVKIFACRGQQCIWHFGIYHTFDLRVHDICEAVLMKCDTVKTLNIGTPRPATVVVLNVKPFNFTMK